MVHVTVSPTATSTSSGENARLARVAAPDGMVTADAGPPVDGDGDGDGDGDADGDADGDGDGEVGVDE